jgi:hypothetical protein
VDPSLSTRALGLLESTLHTLLAPWTFGLGVRAADLRPPFTADLHGPPGDRLTVLHILRC